MTTVSAAIIFSLCFAFMALSSFMLGGNLERLAARFHWSGGLLGIISALGADAPEISSAVTAVLIGQHDIGAGIIVGSNIFNLAGLLGLSALVAGRLATQKHATLFNGGTAILVTLIFALLIFKLASPFASVALLALLLIPYVICSGIKSSAMERWRLPESIRVFLFAATVRMHRDLGDRKTLIRNPRLEIFLGGCSVIVIIATGMWLVRSAVFLSNQWGLSKIIVGTFILAILTSIPNVITAIKLARDDRGIAVMSESLNSNSINVFFGVAIPAALLGLGSLSAQTIFSVWWLLGMTVVSVSLLYFKKVFGRMDGLIIVGLYLIFAAVMMNWK